jgi:hypothetical protein
VKNAPFGAEQRMNEAVAARVFLARGYAVLQLSPEAFGAAPVQHGLRVGGPHGVQLAVYLDEHDHLSVRLVLVRLRHLYTLAHAAGPCRQLTVMGLSARTRRYGYPRAGPAARSRAAAAVTLAGH